MNIFGPNIKFREKMKKILFWAPGIDLYAAFIPRALLTLTDHSS